jgi:hypothetical protein
MFKITSYNNGTIFKKGNSNVFYTKNGVLISSTDIILQSLSIDRFSMKCASLKENACFNCCLNAMTSNNLDCLISNSGACLTIN